MKKRIIWSVGVFIVFFLGALSVGRVALACLELECQKSETKNMWCPNPCVPGISYGLNCSGCTQRTCQQSVYGGSTSIIMDDTCDCGYWKTGTCTIGGACAGIMSETPCMDWEVVASC